MTDSQIQAIIKTLILQPDEFTPSHAQKAFTEMMQMRAKPAEIAAFLVALKLHGKDKDPRVVAACSESMLEFAKEVDFSAFNNNNSDDNNNNIGLQDLLVDVVG